MPEINKPNPPYILVAFRSKLKPGVEPTYNPLADEMDRLAGQQPGFLGFEFYNGEGVRLTLSYWKDEESLRAWREHAVHRQAQGRGHSEFYEWYETQVSTVVRRKEWTAT